MLQKIKLLRQLSIPIEEILKLQKGYLTLEDCMRRHMIFLDREEENVKQKKSICAQLEADGQQLSTMDTEKYLLLMEQMEKEGVRFMNVKHVDQIPVPILGILIAFPVVIIGGVLLALKERRDYQYE